MSDSPRLSGFALEYVLFCGVLFVDAMLVIYTTWIAWYREQRDQRLTVLHDFDL